MNTGKLIKKFRKERGMTQLQLAEKVGIAESSIRQYELGMRNPKTERLKEIAEALRVPFACLLGFETEIAKEKNLADFSTEEILAEMKRRIESDNSIRKNHHSKCIVPEK